MRRIAALVALLVLASSCDGRPPRPVEDTVRVRVDNCSAANKDHVLAGLRGLLPTGVAFVEVEPGGRPDMVVACGGPLFDDAAGQFQSGRFDVLVDPTRVQDLALQAVAAHEGMHWYIWWRGRHPERAKFHVCRLQGDEAVRADCYPHAYGTPHLMNYALGSTDYEGPGFNEAFVGAIPQYEPTWIDVAFFDWATGRDER